MGTMTSVQRLSFWVVSVVLIGVGTVLPARAEVFHIEVRVILASNSDEGFDPRLLDLKKDLLSLNYMSFQLLDNLGLAVDRGTTGKIRIPGGRSMELTPTDFEKGKINMNVKILEKGASLLTTRIRIENHGTVILGGPPFQQGFLVLAVTANL
jgi:hypothetical protein